MNRDDWNEDLRAERSAMRMLAWTVTLVFAAWAALILVALFGLATLIGAW